MSQSQTPEFIDNAIAGGIGATIAAVIIGILVWGFRSHLASYLKMKGENLATKEDIQQLTRLQQEIKAEFDKILENQRIEGQLRLAVVERRFQAYQDAHTLWLKLFHTVHVGDIGQTVMDCQEWWEKNSLYLDSESRRAFNLAYHAAADHRDFLKGPRDKEHRKVIEENWRRIVEAGSLIEAAVDLPKLDISDLRRSGEPEPTALGDGKIPIK